MKKLVTILGTLTILLAHKISHAQVIGVTPFGLATNQTTAFLGDLSITGQDGLINTVSTITFVNGSVSVIDQMQTDVTIFPNPTSNRLYLHSSEPIQHVELFALSGKKIWQSNAATVIDLSALQAGSYILSINQEKTIIFQKH